MIHPKSHTTTDGRPETGLARWTKHFNHAGRTWSLVKRADAEAAPYWLDTYIRGRRVKRSLETNIAKVAQERAIAKYLKPAIEGRWNEIEDDTARRPVCATIGEVAGRYEACELLLTGKRTRRNNALALRMLVRQGLDLAEGAGVDDQPVSVLTKKLVRAFQEARLKGVGEDRLARDRAATSANSTWNQARSLFGRRAVALELYQGLELGDLSCFTHAPQLETLKRDHYDLPPAEDLAKILGELDTLRADNPALWLVLTLAMQSGLRRSELVAMRWRWLETAAIRVRFEADFIPKGKKERVVPVASGVLQQVRQVAQEQQWPSKDDDYVLPRAAREARRNLFRALGVWLRAHGWTRRQKAHELRKVYASVLTAAAGAYAAKAALGHQDIRTTERYAAKPEIAPVDIAAALQARTAPAPSPAPAGPPVLTVVQPAAQAA